MSVAAHLGRWRPGRLPLAVLALVCLAAVVVVALSGMKGTVSYYRTPTELVTAPPSTQSVRLGGLVTAGSVTHHGAVVRFVLTDGANDIHVVTRDVPPATFRAGQGAVVEGHLLGGGVFSADRVMVRHSNEYRPPSTAAATRTSR